MLFRFTWRVLHVPLNVDNPKEVARRTSPFRALTWSLIWSEWISSDLGLKRVIVYKAVCCPAAPVSSAGSDAFRETDVTGERMRMKIKKNAISDLARGTIGSPDRDFAAIRREERNRTPDLATYILGNQFDVMFF